MLYIICIAINIIAIISFVKRKWHFAALAYSFALLTLVSISSFLVNIPPYINVIKNVLGEDFYKEVLEFIKDFSTVALAPYLGVELISLIYALVVVLKTAEKIINDFVNSKKELIFRNNDFYYLLNDKLDDSFELKQKTYLLNCQLLC